MNLEHYHKEHILLNGRILHRAKWWSTTVDFITALDIAIQEIQEETRQRIDLLERDFDKLLFELKCEVVLGVKYVS